MEGHPLLEKVSEQETKEDPCVKFMCEDTDEARKVIRNEGSIWHAVFRKRDINDENARADISKKVQQFYM